MDEKPPIPINSRGFVGYVLVSARVANSKRDKNGNPSFCVDSRA
jgi:hypothetical protein